MVALGLVGGVVDLESYRETRDINSRYNRLSRRL